MKPAAGGLTGPIPPELGQLSKLRILRFRNQSLSGAIPSELGKLANLGNMLDLSGNHLTESIPPELGRVGRLTRIAWGFDLSGNQLSGSIPPELGQLQLRGNFNLSDNQLSGPIPPELGRLTQIGASRHHGQRELNLSFNQLTDSIPNELSNLKSVFRINLSHNQLTGPLPRLSGFNKLQHLHLNDNALSGSIPSGYGQLTELRDLNLANNALTGTIPQSLGDLPNLMTIDLGGNRFSPPVPDNLASPRPDLDVNLEPRYTTRRADSPCTHEIGAADSRVDCDALWEFYSTLQDRGILDDPDHPGRWGPDTPLSEWYGVQLRTERYGDRYETHTGPVTGLLLNQAGIAGPMSPALGDLKDLGYLDLSWNDLTGPIPPDITRLKNLRAWIQPFNRLSGPIPKGIGQLPRLTRVDLRGNPIEEPWPANLTNPQPALNVRLPGRVKPLELSGPRYTVPGIPVNYTTSLPDGVDHYTYFVRASPDIDTSYPAATEISFIPPTGGTYRLGLAVEDYDVPGDWYVGLATVVVFTDVSAGSSAQEIAWIAHRGITDGCGGGRFCPDGSVTRGQMTAFFNRALKLPATTQDYFDDDTGSVFEGDINRLAAAGITQGCEPQQFCPANTITRGQMASFLTRALNLPPSTRDRYRDDDGTTHEDSINRLAEAGIARACDPNRYCPGAVLTRQEMAGFLYRARSHLAVS